jgi:hypothetical protein
MPEAVLAGDDGISCMVFPSFPFPSFTFPAFPLDLNLAAWLTLACAALVSAEEGMTRG